MYITFILSTKVGAGAAVCLFQSLRKGVQEVNDSSRQVGLKGSKSTNFLFLERSKTLFAHGSELYESKGVWESSEYLYFASKCEMLLDTSSFAFSSVNSQSHFVR